MDLLREYDAMSCVRAKKVFNRSCSSRCDLCTIEKVVLVPSLVHHILRLLNVGGVGVAMFLMGKVFFFLPER
jgi:hypothetical protein